MTYGNYETENADKSKSNSSGMESQDEEDMRHGARSGGGFTSSVSIHPHADNELMFIQDKLKGCGTTHCVGSPEENARS